MRFGILLFIAAVKPFSPILGQEHPKAVELTYLANEGFLLRSGQDAVLIDAFVKRPYSIYRSVSKATWDQMIARRAPFQHIRLALVSHRHEDHFQADAAMAFMQNHPETMLISSPEVVDLLEKEPGYERVKHRVRRQYPDPGQLLTWSEGGISVDFLRLTHGGRRWQNLHNLGHVIHLGGLKILHVGDAETDAKHYQPYKKAVADLDIALVPYWVYLEPSGLQLIKEVYRAKFEVAVHIPNRDRRKIMHSLKQDHPHVILFEKEGSSRKFNGLP